jgi:hypothetical protein
MLSPATGARHIAPSRVRAPMSGQPARDVMDRSPATLSAKDTVGSGIGRVVECHFRHVSIMDGQGCSLGVFGVNCVVRLRLPQVALMEQVLTL